ncbi:hypothetical protein F2Q68_00005824 [Brassica cretica]|uniref:Uncharacterized protein n=1 Tax=Brassica cretica TaxID=69181 RepID=A0A8S9J4M0_BRACR|nr:hypothetical protein F2Q68_00005824 [Brassica cretica]
MKAILSSSVAPRLSGDNPSLRGSSDETESSLSVARRRKDDSLSLFVAPRGNEARPLSLSLWLTARKEIVDYLALYGSPRRRRTALSLWVDILESEGSILSRGGSRRWRYMALCRWRYMALCRWLSSTATELSVDASPRFVQGKLLFHVIQ